MILLRMKLSPAAALQLMVAKRSTVAPKQPTPALLRPAKRRPTPPQNLPQQQLLKFQP